MFYSDLEISPEKVREAALEFMAEKGILPRLVHDRNLILDGKIHRYDIEGQKRNSKNGAYSIHADGFPNGFFQDWSNPDARFKWKYPLDNEDKKSYSKVSSIDINQWKQKKEEQARQQEKKYSESADYARIKISNAKNGNFEHAYLSAKNLNNPHGARLSNDGRLLIPLFDINKKITSLQYIEQDGTKRFLQDTKLSGSFFPVNMNIDISKDNPTILIGEGFATMASISELTDKPCIAAISCSNLSNVCSAIINKFPFVKIIIIADNDIATFQEKGFNPGLDAATKCQEAYKKNIITILYPPFIDENGSDWNDYLNTYGPSSPGVKKLIRDINFFSLNEEGRKDFIQRELIEKFSYEIDIKLNIPALDLIGGFFPRGYLSAIVAPPGTGKTMFIQKLVSDLSIGGNILDSFIEDEPIRRSLIFAAEAGFNMLVRRATSLKWKFNPALIKVADQYTLNLNNISLLLDEPEGLENVRKFIEINKPDIVFFDSFMNFHTADENKSHLMKPILVSLAALAREFDISIVLVHHTRKRTAKERIMELHQDDAVGSGILNRYVAVLVGLERSKEQHDFILVHSLKAWEKEFPPFRYRISDNNGAGIFESYFEDKNGDSIPIQNSKESLWLYITLNFKRGEWFKFEDIDIEAFEPPITIAWMRKIISGFVKNGKLSKRGNTRMTEYAII